MAPAIFFILYLQNSVAQDKIVYKTVDTISLSMEIYSPEKLNPEKKYPAIIFFFGGGWTTGSITQFEPFAKYFSEKGLISILVDYRVKSRNGTSPFESLKDAKSAIRFLRSNAAKFHVDPDKIIASGGSAGGHLAAACFTNETINEANDDFTVSAKPNSLVLFNPVIDNSKEGFGYDKIGGRYLEFSPLHNIQKGFPSTVFFLGTKDKLIPVSTAELFKYKIDSVGSRCDLFLYEGQEHGFFNKEEYRNKVIPEINIFLKSLGFL